MIAAEPRNRKRFAPVYGIQVSGWDSHRAWSITLKTSSRIIARAPTSFSLCMRARYDSKLGSLHSITDPVQKNRKMRGDASKEQKRMVMRPFSRKWLIVSPPEPVASTYAASFGPRMANEASGRPLGERLICRPLRGAEAVKNTFWLKAQSRRSGDIDG